MEASDETLRQWLRDAYRVADDLGMTLQQVIDRELRPADWAEVLPAKVDRWERWKQTRFAV